MDRREFNKTMGVVGAGVASGLGAYAPGVPPLGGAESGAAQSAIDVARARRDTPGCAHVTHFNNAGSALPPQPVIAAVQGHLSLEAEIGGYEAADAADAQRRRTYQAVARLLNCSEAEIAIVENATRAWDMAFYAMSFEPGQRILTCASEYASNYIAYLQAARRTGVTVDVVANDGHGQVSLDALRSELAKGDVALVGVTHVPTNGGLVNPAEEIGALTREAGVPYLLDACQSAGQWPLDVERIGCDMLSVTGRKYLRGPRGTGFLYVRSEMIPRLEPPLLDLHAARWVERDRFEIDPTARRFENWESYVAGGIGLGAAIEYAMGWGIDAIQERVVALAEHLRGALEDVPGLTVRDLGEQRCGLVTFTVDGSDPVALKAALRERRINTSTSGRSSTRIDMEARGLESMIRASVHYYNTEEEVDLFVRALRELV